MGLIPHAACEAMYLTAGETHEGHTKDCHGPSLHIVPVVANRSARKTTSIDTWSCVPGEMGGSRLRDEQQVLNIQQQPWPPLKKAA